MGKNPRGEYVAGRERIVSVLLTLHLEREVDHEMEMDESAFR